MKADRWLGGWRRTSLRLRLQIWLITFLLIFLALLGYLSFRNGNNSLRREVETANRRLAALAGRDVSAQYDAILTNIRLLRTQMQDQQASLADQAQTMLTFRRNSPQVYRALYLLDTQGLLLVHLAERTEQLLRLQSAAELLSRPPITLGTPIQDAYQSALGGTMTMSAAQIVGIDLVPVIYVGILLADSQEIGQVIVAEIDLRTIWRRVDEVQMGETGRAFVVSGQGVIIAHPDRSYIGRPLPSALEPVLSGFEGQTSYQDPLSGQTMLASYSPVSKQSGWGIIIEQEQAETLAPVYRLAYGALAVMAMAVILGSVAATLLGRGIARPIQHLAEVTQRIAATGELNERVEVSSDDEVGDLAIAFNQMIASLAEANAALKEYSIRLEEMVEERTRELNEAQEKLVRREKLAVLGQLAGGVGHELRNPLGVISNAVYLLKTVCSPAENSAHEYLAIIEEEVANASRIVADLLDYARTRPAAREAISTDTLVHKALEYLPAPAGIQIDCQLPADLPRLYVDPAQIQMVLRNLILNGYQAMPTGGLLTLRAEVARRAVQIQISDTGQGISPENLARLFEPLFTTKARGIGLGLALSRNLVLGNDGNIAAESEGVPGKGSTFVLTLPSAD